MAYQLHYTSSADGLSGYPGFQFVAVSPGLPTGLEYVVSRYLSYRLPPSVPPLPDAEEIDRLPTAFCYDMSPYGPILACCRYLGVDYSGRPGNFFGHAIVATQEELSGLRPIEFWKASWWAAGPSAGEPKGILPQLTMVRPDSVIEPRRILKELSVRDGAPGLLATIVDTTLRVMENAKGQIILIAQDIERIVTWIAAISYSLPYSLIADLSFITFTAEPGEVPFRLVGTNTSVWRERGARGYGFDLDELSAPEECREPGRFGMAVAQAWRTGDLLRIDSISELAGLLLPAKGEARTSNAINDCETAAALAQMCAGEPLAPGDVAHIIDVLQRTPGRLPEQAWQALAGDADHDYELALAAWRAAGRLGRTRETDQIGVSCVRRALQNPSYRRRLHDPGPLTGTAKFAASEAVRAALQAARALRDVAEIAWVSTTSRLQVEQGAVEEAAQATIADDLGGLEAALVAVPEEYASCFISGAVTGLESAPEHVRTANLTSEVCRRVANREWRPWPHVGSIVLADIARQEPARRVELTGQMLGLSRELRATAEDIDELLAEVWPEPPSAWERRLLLNDVSSLQWEKARYQLLAFVARPWDRITIRQSAEYEIACRICQLDNGQNATLVAIDACLIRILHEIGKGTERQRFERALQLEHYLPRGSTTVAAGVAEDVARVVVGFPPSFQAALMARRASPEGPQLQSELRALWLSEQRNDPVILANLAEVAIDLQRNGGADPALEAHVAKRSRASGLSQHVFSELDRRDRSLGEGFHQLMGERVTHLPRRKRGWIKLGDGLVKKYLRDSDEDGASGGGPTRADLPT